MRPTSQDEVEVHGMSMEVHGRGTVMEATLVTFWVLHHGMDTGMGIGMGIGTGMAMGMGMVMVTDLGTVTLAVTVGIK